MDIQPTQTQSTPKALNRSYLFIAMLAAILLVAGGFVFYNTSRQKNPANTPKNTQTAQPPSQSPVKTEFTNGQVISFKNQVLTIKDANSQERQLKVASNATILKQKWFDANSMGTVPAEVKINDQVSVQTIKNSSGETEVISVVILADKPTTDKTASKSGEKK